MECPKKTVILKQRYAGHFPVIHLSFEDSTPLTLELHWVWATGSTLRSSKST